MGKFPKIPGCITPPTTDSEASYPWSGEEGEEGELEDFSDFSDINFDNCPWCKDPSDDDGRKTLFRSSFYSMEASGTLSGGIIRYS